MVVGTAPTERADQLFHALADSTRRDIIRRCFEEDHSVSVLARAYPMSFAAVQKHVAVLERARLITKRRQGREQLVRTNVDAVHELSSWLDQLEALWRARIDRFDEVLVEAPSRGAST
jgi:DNA-binding transcriptional ArsR family regulator